MTSCNPLLHLEDAIGEISRKMPGSPRTEIMLTRLHFYVQLQLGAWFESSLKPYGLNHSAWLALMLIYSRPQERVSPSDISATLAFSRTNATRVVDELEGRGWIQRHPCPDDRRKTELGLTELQVQDNLMFTADKIGEPMRVAARSNEQKQWFGASPPDLSLVAKARASADGSGADFSQDAFGT